jgi:energy-coupling factor transporter transmembrane protein EcfT
MRFLAIVLLALALAPVTAHLLALPNKIDVPEQQYFTDQSIYYGWALPTGIVLISAIVVSLVLTIMSRGRGMSFWFALVGFLLITATLVVFFIWTFPANQATVNWTTVPDNWRELRQQWEYSHATNAVLTFLALCAVTLSALTGSRSATNSAG